MPKDVLLLVGQLIVRHMYWEANLCCMSHKLALHLLHLVAVPTHHRILIYRAALVGNNKIFVDADNVAVALTGWASTIGVVEREEVGVRFFEAYAIGLEPVGELLFHSLAGNQAGPMPFEEGTLHAFGHAGGLLVVGLVHLYAVHQQAHLPLQWHAVQVVDSHHSALHHHTLVALAMQYLNLCGKGAFFAVDQRSKDIHPLPRTEAEYIVHHIAHHMSAHLYPTHGRIGATHTGKHQLQVLVNLGLRADGGARVACVDLLFDSHRRREAVYIVDIGLRHAAQKLAGIRAHALHIPALPLGKEGVECQTRLATAAEARNHNQLAQRKAQVDILQVVGACAMYFNFFSQSRMNVPPHGRRK